MFTSFGASIDFCACIFNGAGRWHHPACLSGSAAAAATEDWLRIYYGTLACCMWLAGDAGSTTVRCDSYPYIARSLHGHKMLDNISLRSGAHSHMHIHVYVHIYIYLFILLGMPGVGWIILQSRVKKGFSHYSWIERVQTRIYYSIISMSEKQQQK